MHHHQTVTNSISSASYWFRSPSPPGLVSAAVDSSSSPPLTVVQNSSIKARTPEMSSRSKNFRRRPDPAADEEKTSSSPSSAANKTQTLAKKPKPHKSEAPKRLSFAEDEDDDDAPAPITARTRPPSTAALHKITFAKDRSTAATTAAPPPVFSNVQPLAGEYTKERLRELQKNARPLGSSIPKSQPLPSTTNPEPVIILKGLLKPPSPRHEPGPIPAPAREQEMEEEMEVKDRGSIPDQETINAIRAKRERLRQTRGPAPEYISLDGSGVLSSRGSGGGSSDDEDTECRVRTALFGDKDGTAKKGVFEDVDEKVMMADPRVVGVGFGAAEDDDEDEEERKWEEEQFRKALGKRIEVSVPSVVPVQPQPAVYSEVAHQPSSSSLPPGTSFGVTWGGEVITIRQQGEVALRAFHEGQNRLQATYDNETVPALNRFTENISESLNEITNLEKSLKDNNKKFIFIQHLQDFISVVCEFLDVKASFIDELEEHMQKLHEERASSVEDRRDADIVDEQSEMEAAVNAAMSVLSKGTGPTFIYAATTAAQAAAVAARESFNLPPQLDEFGRDINLQRRTDYARRVETRKRKRDRSESKRMSFVGKNNESKYIEGELSTDESDSESSAYQSSRDELLETAGRIFSDATDEYSKLSNVKDMFESFKRLYPTSYRDAYISLSVPIIFSRFVRLELLKWDPLYNKTIFGDMEWHNILLDYGLPGEGRSFDTDDADDKLVPELVEQVALPILHHEIEHCWDVFSTQQTENAVFAADMIMSYIPLDSKTLHEFLAVVCSRLTKAITNLSVPTWSSIVIKAVPGAAQYVVYKFGMSLRLLRNICLWKGVLPLPVLEKLALEELLIGKLLPHVRSSMSNIHDAFTKIQRIDATLSGVWYGSNVQGVQSQKLQPLVECMAEFGRKLEKRHAAGVSDEDTIRLVRRLKTMLVELNEHERARAMLRTFQLKEAL